MAKQPNTEKRVLKTEPKLKVDLNEEQKEFVELFYQYDVNFLLGDFGSGKSLAAVHTALKSFRNSKALDITGSGFKSINAYTTLDVSKPLISKS